METWQEMSKDCLRAAKRLLDAGLYRRSISSSYYAANLAATQALEDVEVHFAHGWHNPAHSRLPDLILHNLPLSRDTRFRSNKAIRRLRLEREMLTIGRR